MWIFVMFDLPVVEKEDREAAVNFRDSLLELGFEMIQFSVYCRFCAGSSKVDYYTGKVEQQIPPYGKVNILSFTDKQFSQIKSFKGAKKNILKPKPDQFDLF